MPPVDPAPEPDARPYRTEVPLRWSDMDAYVIHQISSVHTAGMCKRTGIDPERVPKTFPVRGNIGPASVPTTLARRTI